jgi:carbonic anhydrase
MKTLASVFDGPLTPFIEPVSRCELNQRLTTGIATGVAVICCSEMGNVNSVFPDDPNLPIFTWQNLGGCVNDCGGLDELIAEKQISDVIVLGHYGCEIIEVGLRSDPQADDSAKRIYKEVARRTAPTRDAMRARFGDRFDKTIFRKAVEDFVLRELASLLKLPSVYNAANNGQLRVHAWINHDDTMESASYDPTTRTFWVLPDDDKH